MEEFNEVMEAFDHTPIICSIEATTTLKGTKIIGHGKRIDLDILAVYIIEALSNKEDVTFATYLLQLMALYNAIKSEESDEEE